MTSPACPACTGQWPAPEQRIADCGSTIAYLHDDQFFGGWTFLVLKRHATELWQLEAAERTRLIEEITRVAQALGAAFGAVKMNYELLGNLVPHIHWHLVPRLATDPALRSPIWTVEHEAAPLAPAAARERIEIIRRALT